MKKILIATPCHSNLEIEYVTSLVRLIQMSSEQDVSFHPLFLRSSAIHQIRNQYLAIFLRSTEYTHLLFIDSDIGFAPESVFQLLDHDKEFSGIAYQAKGDAYTGYNVHSSDASIRCPETGMMKVDGMGGGFILLKRCVAEKMVKGYPELKCLGFPKLSKNQEENNRHYYNLFDWSVNPRTNYILSEDFTFCHRWRKLGGEIWVDINQGLAHIGRKAYTGKLADNIVNNIIVVRKHE